MPACATSAERLRFTNLRGSAFHKFYTQIRCRSSSPESSSGRRLVLAGNRDSLDGNQNCRILTLRKFRASATALVASVAAPDCRLCSRTQALRAHAGRGNSAPPVAYHSRPLRRGYLTYAAPADACARTQHASTSDIRNCMSPSVRMKLCSQLFQHRSTKLRPEGHSFGNLFFRAYHITQTFQPCAVVEILGPVPHSSRHHVKHRTQP